MNDHITSISCKSFRDDELIMNERMLVAKVQSRKSYESKVRDKKENHVIVIVAFVQYPFSN
jgi:hypothetical protein